MCLTSNIICFLWKSSASTNLITLFTKDGCLFQDSSTKVTVAQAFRNAKLYKFVTGNVRISR